LFSFFYFYISFIFVGYSDQHKGSKSGEPCAKIPSFLSFLCFLVAVLKISAYINKELPERRTGQAKLLLQGLQPNNRTLFPTDELNNNETWGLIIPGNTVSEEDPSRQALILPINVSVFFLYCELLYQYPILNLASEAEIPKSGTCAHSIMFMFCLNEDFSAMPIVRLSITLMREVAGLQRLSLLLH
ncbi:hypothetical protein ACJX0J_002910, partial (mitochondrion) [Zea mays]